MPKAQPRPRFVRGRVISTVDPATRAWKDAVLRAVHAAGVKFDGAVCVEATVFLPTKDQSRWGKPHLMKPDRDNLDKAILDSITAAAVWVDDSVAWSGGVCKVWCQPGYEGAVLTFTPTPKVEGVSPPWERLERPAWLGRGDGESGMDES